jgi:hypothetical protein
MATLWTTPADIVDRWVGNDTPTDTALLTALIEDAEATILAEYPLIQDRIDGGTLSAQLVTMVTVRMVNRQLRNPESLSSWQQTTGPFSQSRTFGTNSDFLMTNDERALLAPSGRGKAFSLDLAPNAHEARTMYQTAEDTEEARLWRDIDEDD